MKQKIIHLVSRSMPISLLGGLIASGIAFAASSIPSAPTLVSNADSLENLFCPIDNAMFWVLISVAIIMVMWAAYLYLTAGDDTEKVHRATKTLTYAAVAVIVGILAKGFPNLISSVFGTDVSNTPWAGC